jgi:long-chain acyl-CoA synthetase
MTGRRVPQPQNMIYTSGTTGHPKGVRRNAPTPEQAPRERMRAMIYGLKPGARALLPGPLYHSAPNSFGLRAGRLGGALVLMPRFDPEEFLRLIEAEKIDTIFMVPTMFIRLMKLPEQVRRKYDMSSLRHIIHAAAPCPADVKRAMIEWWGPVIYEFYGSTESGAVTFANSEDALKKPGTVGKISPGAELRFIGDDGKVLPQGRDRRDLFADRRQSGFHLSQQAGEARRDRARRLHHLGRRRLYRRGRLRLHLRPQARHGDLGRRQHLSRRDRGGAACVPGVHDCAVFGIPDENSARR